MRNRARVVDRVTFLFALALVNCGVTDSLRASAQAPEKEGPRAEYFPHITLQTQDGKDVRFFEDLIKGKILLINFMYTHCAGKL
jgi:protein SCO1/2